MRVAELGEFGLIARIGRLAERVQGRGVVLGIGDDAAVLRPAAGEDIVVSTDAYVEGVHFRRGDGAASGIGHRALAANLSDLAAMGARPRAFLLSATLPPSTQVRFTLGLVGGMLALAERHHCPLVGGNVTRGREIGLTLTVLGAVRRGRALRRSAARVGDRLFVTGALGAAARARARSERSAAPLRHRPEPRIAAGLALARMRHSGACIDVSDGLVADLGHLLEASGVGARIDPARLPAARGASLREVLAGGEDYELLFTIRPGGPGSGALARRLGVAVSEIGAITRSGLEGLPSSAPGGFEHF